MANEVQTTTQNKSRIQKIYDSVSSLRDIAEVSALLDRPAPKPSTREIYDSKELYDRDLVAERLTHEFGLRGIENYVTVSTTEEGAYSSILNNPDVKLALALPKSREKSSYQSLLEPLTKRILKASKKELAGSGEVEIVGNDGKLSASLEAFFENYGLPLNSEQNNFIHSVKEHALEHSATMRNTTTQDVESSRAKLVFMNGAKRVIPHFDGGDDGTISRFEILSGKKGMVCCVDPEVTEDARKVYTKLRDAEAAVKGTKGAKYVLLKTQMALYTQRLENLVTGFPLGNVEILPGMGGYMRKGHESGTLHWSPGLLESSFENRLLLVNSE